MEFWEWKCEMADFLDKIRLSVKSSKANEDNGEIWGHERNFRARNSRRYESDL